MAIVPELRDDTAQNGSGWEMTDRPDEIVIHAGRLLAEPGQAVLRQQSIRIEDGRIVQVAAGFVDPPPGRG